MVKYIFRGNFCIYFSLVLCFISKRPLKISVKSAKREALRLFIYLKCSFPVKILYKRCERTSLSIWKALVINKCSPFLALYLFLHFRPIQKGKILHLVIDIIYVKYPLLGALISIIIKQNGFITLNHCKNVVSFSFMIELQSWKETTSEWKERMKGSEWSTWKETCIIDISPLHHCCEGEKNLS